MSKYAGVYLNFMEGTMSYAEKYVEVLDEEGLNHSEITEKDGIEIVRFGMHTKNKDVQVSSMFRGEVVSNGIWGITKVPEDKLADALFVCNDFNQRFNFVKFVINNDLEVELRSEGIIDEETAGKEAFHLVISMIRIVDETYPELMKVIWS